jgi:lycopene cyclase domain-containing protein
VNIFQGHNTYLYLNILTLLGPLFLSFDKKVAFYKDWKYFLYAMLPTSLAYIVWDIIATKTLVWKFNPQYLLGINIINLPIEEYMFFLVVPYACLFIYACLRAYWPDWHFPKLNSITTYAIITLSAICIIYNPTHAYTTSTFGLLAITYIILLYIKYNHHLTHLIISWAVALLPMAFVNGILTGNPVLIYNDAENLGIRIGTIPFEDFFYNLLYMTWMITLFEIFKSRQTKTSISKK